MSAWPSFRVFPARNLTGQTKMVKDSANVVDLQMSLVQKIGQLRKAEIRLGVQIGSSQVSRKQVGVGGCGDHGGVVGGKRAAGEKNVHARARGFGLEAFAQFGIGGDASGNQDRARSCFRRGVERARHEIANDGGLKIGNQRERARAAQRQQIGGLCGGPPAAPSLRASISSANSGCART